MSQDPFRDEDSISLTKPALARASVHLTIRRPFGQADIATIAGDDTGVEGIANMMLRALVGVGFSERTAAEWFISVGKSALCEEDD